MSTVHPVCEFSLSKHHYNEIVELHILDTLRHVIRTILQE